MATAFREVKKGVEVLASGTWNSDSSWRCKQTWHLCEGRLLQRKAEKKITSEGQIMGRHWTTTAFRIQVNKSSFITDDKSEVNASIFLSACDSTLSWHVILAMKLFGGLSVTFKKGNVTKRRERFNTANGRRPKSSGTVTWILRMQGVGFNECLLQRKTKT